MVERSGCIFEESNNGTSLHNSQSTSTKTSTVKDSFESNNNINQSNHNRFSIFKWFKRNSSVRQRPINYQHVNSNNQNVSKVSSSESINTYYSTTTVKSFAFHPGIFTPVSPVNLHNFNEKQREVGPFAAGASKVIGKIGDNTTGTSQTLPANVLSHNHCITTRYSLQLCNTGVRSCDNIHDSDRKSSNNRLYKRRVHVKGKKRAPDPPLMNPKSTKSHVGNVTLVNKHPKRRPAPQPPVSACNREKIDEKVIDFDGNIDDSNVNSMKSDCLVEVMHENKIKTKIDNNILIIQGDKMPVNHSVGSSTSFSHGKQREYVMEKSSSSSMMPRPWYKRSVFENSIRKNNSLQTCTIMDMKNDESVDNCNEISLSRLKFFHRDGRNIKDRSKDVKQRSGLSILTNISELDKEAAAIVQKEQTRIRALLSKQTSSIDSVTCKRVDDNQHKVIQNIVTSAIGSPPKRGTRALISKFNAIGNISKVTVNSNFFDENLLSNDVDNSNDERQMKMINSKVHPDLKKYFPQCTSSKITSMENIKSSSDNSKFFSCNTDVDVGHKKSEIISETEIKKIRHKNLMDDVNDKLTTLQSIITQSSFDDVKSSSINATKSTGKSKNELISRGKDDYIKENMKRSVMCSTNVPKISINQSNYQINPVNIKQTYQLSNKEKILKHVDDSNQVDKVLDILVKTQKIECTNWKGSKKISETESNASKLLNKIDNSSTIDLKEMLKEMKHSLPKRVKPKLPIEKKILIDNQIKDAISPNFVKSNQNEMIDPSEIHIRHPIKLQSLQIQNNKTKSKVSSAAQTSGNLRKIISNTPTKSIESPSTSQSNNNNVIYKTMRKKFQLMRPREFAAIGAIKTSQNPTNDYAIYANIIPETMPSSALISSSKNHHDATPNNFPIDNKKNILMSPVITGVTSIMNNATNYNWNDNNKLQLKFCINDDENSASLFHPNDHETIEKDRDSRGNIMTERRMNTLVINRLIKKLENAIASGHHQEAAGYAKELASLKVKCSVIRHKAKTNNLLNVDMYIEDRLAHQGPIPIQVSLLMTIKQLKEKISNDFNIPANVQRWIINNTLAENNDDTLNGLNAVEGSQVFLYLVAPDLQTIDLNKQIMKKANDENDNQDVDDDLIEEPEKNSNHDEESEEENFNEIPNKESIIEDEKDEEETEGAVASAEIPDPKEYQELIMLESCGIVPNTETIKCPICFMDCEAFEGIRLRDCLHEFCRNCLVETVKHCQDAEVKCPYRDADYACESTIQEREIKSFVDPSIYESYLAKSILQAENKAGDNAFHCKTPNCPVWYLYDDQSNHFRCPTCSQTNCLTCRAIHDGKNCYEYQEYIRLSQDSDPESKKTAELLANMLARGEAMRCPTCNILIMKKEGCDWLQCRLCTTEICWVTRGPRWGPRGHGDTSGGCKCNVQGIKCHIDCRHCH